MLNFSNGNWEFSGSNWSKLCFFVFDVDVLGYCFYMPQDGQHCRSRPPMLGNHRANYGARKAEGSRERDQDQRGQGSWTSLFGLIHGCPPFKKGIGL
jgi:hypothetical protein